MNKLMFVDVDGVLNNRATLSAGTSCWLLDPNCLLLLKDIVDKTGAKIVISSTWRCFEKGLVTLKQHFRKHNIPNWIGCTEDLNNKSGPWSSGNHINRSEEISKWILDNNVDQDNDRIAIIDDDIDACLVPKWFFHTSFNEGLTREVAGDIITHLNA